MDVLKQELKELIIRTLKLEDLTPENLVDDAPLFQEGLGLDSVDLLELTVAIEKKYRLSIPDQETGKRAFGSLNALASFVAENRAARSSA